jgi:ubiquinol-cytochrome c reductase cytochrome c subunit
MIPMIRKRGFMNRIVHVLCASLLALTAPVVAQTPAPVPTGNAQNGRKLFASNGCYECHGYEAQGATPTGPRLGPRPLAFAAFSKYVRQPTGQMPPYSNKIVTDAALADIYAFLQSLPAPKGAETIPLLK